MKQERMMKQGSFFYYWENKQNQRYYLAHLMQDLFKDWVLVRAWGKKGSALGRKSSLYCADFQEGQEKLDRLLERRKRHGYTICDYRSGLQSVNDTLNEK